MSIELSYMIAICFTIVISMTILGFICFSSLSLKFKTKIKFIIIFIVVSIASIFDVVSIVLNESGRSDLIWLAYFSNFVYFALAPLVIVLLSRIIFDGKPSLFALGGYGVYLITIIILSCFDLVFAISKDNIYSRGPAFYFFVATYIAFVVYLLICTIRLSKKLLSQNPYVLFALFTVLLGGSAAQIFIEKVYFQFLVIAITVIIFYGYVSSLFAQTDGLTGLFNQYAFLKMVKYIKEGETIIVMDADDFKVINDLHGHLVGDKVLITIAKVIQQVFGKVGRCYRYGGDEFVAIIKKDVDINALINEFKIAMKKMENENNIFVNVSLGYEKYSKGTKVADFEDAADKKMYLDKARNKKTLLSND